MKNKDKNKERRRERQAEAKQRQEERDSRTPEQQLELIKARRGESKKEAARLSKCLDSLE